MTTAGHLKLRQAGEHVTTSVCIGCNVAERLPIRRRGWRKLALADRQPLVKPTVPNDVWSAAFVYERTVEGRGLKYLTIVDDATTEAVGIIPARALGGVGRLARARSSRDDAPQCLLDTPRYEARRGGWLQRRALGPSATS